MKPGPVQIGSSSYRGLWWTPSAREHQLTGTLAIVDGEVLLDVLGDFGRLTLDEGPGSRALSLMLADQERILGVTVDGRSVTLVGCTEDSSATHLPGLSHVVYRVRVAIFDHQFVDGQEIGLDEVELRTSDLESWVGHVPFGFERLQDETDQAVWGRITFREPPEIDFAVPGGGSVQLRFVSRTTGLSGVVTKATLEFEAWIGLRFSERCSIEQVAGAVEQLRNLLSLAIGRRVAILAVRGRRGDLLGDDGNPKPLAVHYQPARNPDPPARPAHQHEMLFTFIEAVDRLGEVVGAWIDQHELLGPVFALYFGTLSADGWFLEQRFLAYAQAIETYDLRRRPDARLRDRAEHRALLNEILSAVPEDHRQWLSSQLAFSNRLTLAARLEHVLGLCPAVAARIAAPDGVEALSSAVRRTRNYLVHLDPRGEAGAATGRDLYRVTLQLQAVLETVLLHELGFDCESIERMLERGRRFERIAGQR